MLETLTKTEKAVAAQLVKGLSNKEIGKRLFVQEKTVKFHLTSIYRKVGVRSRAEYIAKAGGLVPMWAEEETTSCDQMNESDLVVLPGTGSTN